MGHEEEKISEYESFVFDDAHVQNSNDVKKKDVIEQGRMLFLNKLYQKQRGINTNNI